MDRYFSTFISGAQEIISSELVKELGDVLIETVSDGIVIFKTSHSVDSIKKISYLNNSFILIYQTLLSDRDLLSGLVNKILEVNSKLQFPDSALLRKYKSIRVIASVENQITKIETNKLKQIEEFLSRKTKLKIDRANPDTELWLMARRDGQCLVGLRITKKPDYKSILHKGELRPEVANLMITLAELRVSDTVIDPFAGYGSIPVEVEKKNLVKQIIAIEKDKSVFAVLKNRLNSLRSGIVVKRMDSLNLNNLLPDSVDKIITDPPWGIYNGNLNIKTFYKEMFKEFVRILKKGGYLVLLTAQKEVVFDILSKSTNLKMVGDYNILVSGKKSGLYKIQKI